MSAQIEGGLFVFYDRIIQLCKERNVKPTPLIVELGLSSSNAAQWKKGSTPRPQVLQRIADYFGVSVAYFYETEKTENAPTNSGERAVSDDDIKFALFGGDGEITDEMYDEVKRFAAYIKQREADKK